jgi:hypothetical protein
MNRSIKIPRPAAASIHAQTLVYPGFRPVRIHAADDAADVAAKAAADKAAADAAAGAGGGSGWKPPASQAELDQLVESRLSRERAAARRELEKLKAELTGQTPAELAELEQLRKDKADRERKALEEKGNYDRAVDSIRKEHEQEKAKIAADKEALFNELKQTRCHDALLAAASTSNAINPTQVARLLSDNVKLNDERRVVVLDDDGNPWLKSGKNISIADLIEKFAHDNPHLFKAAEKGKPADSHGGSSTSDEGDGGIDAQITEAQAAYDKAHLEAERTGADHDITTSRLALRKLMDLKKQKQKQSKAA